MLSKKEIYDLEQKNPGVIHLYAEGMFYRAYEQSAFLLCQFIHPFKLSCRFVKSVGDFLTCAGFPQTSVGKWADGRKVLPNFVGGVDICLLINEIADFSEFDEWKNALAKEVKIASETVHFSSNQVYGDAYCLCLELCRLCANLDRTYKYSLGEQLRMTSFRMVMEIENAFSAGSTFHITSARKLLSEIQLCLRLLTDLNAVPQKRFLSFAEMTEKIYRQLISWERAKPQVISAGVPVQ